MSDGITIQHGIANNGMIPIGGIIMWSGTIAAIPTNWQLCNGTNGTPDLRDKFIIGATADNGGAAKTNLTGSLTQSGGAVSHHHADHAFTQPGAHSSHVFTQPGDHAAHTHSVTSNVAITDHSNHTHTGPSHQHNLSGGAATAHGHDYTTVIAHTHKLATGTGASGNFSQVLGSIDASSGGTGAAPTQSNVDTVSQSTGSATGTTANNAAGATDNAGTGASGNESAALSHSITNNAVTSGNPSATLTHSGGAVDAHSAHSGGAVDAHDTLSAPQPYYALAFIQRMA